MADSKISALEVATLNGTEIIPVVQGGVNKRTTVDDIVARDTDPVASVNTLTGAVVLTQDNVGDGTTYKQYSSTEKTKLSGVATGATANSSDATLLSRTNHTGTQSADTLTDGTTNKAFLATERTKLTGIATAATANDTDANLKARANHTGTQTASTISDFSTAADARITAANKKTDSMSTNKLLGRNTAGTGAIEEITLGTNLSMTGTTLNAASGGGGLADGDYGDITVSGSGTAMNIDAGTVGLTELSATGTPTGSNFLRGDNTWATPGGGGSPGGNTNELQYNNAGAFAGAANVEVDTGNLKLVSTTDPSAPSGGIVMYSKQIAGRHLPKIIGPSGIDTIMQVGLHGNSVAMVAPASGTTAPNQWGITLTTATTMSVQQTIASANPWLATWRKRFASAATAAAVTGMRTAYAQWFRGNAAGYGGFFFRTQFGHNLNLNGSHLFVGLCASTAALGTGAGAVAALVNSFGMGYDSTDSSAGNWQFYHNDGSGTATKVDLGANAVRSNVSHGYDMILYCPPGAASDIYVRIVNIHTGTTVLDTSYNTDIPAVNVGLAFKAEVSNVAVASAANIEVAKVYIESDY